MEDVLIGNVRKIKGAKTVRSCHRSGLGSGVVLGVGADGIKVGMGHGLLSGQAFLCKSQYTTMFRDLGNIRHGHSEAAYQGNQ